MNVLGLKNKRILLIAPVFFGYQMDIGEKLEEFGAKVDFLPDRPFQSSFLKAVTRIFRPITTPYSNYFFKKKISGFEEAKFDYIFVIQGESLTPDVLNFIAHLHKNARKILYLWDSLKNKKWLLKNIKFFDDVFTFDISDARKYQINFRPLFFVDKFLGNEPPLGEIGLPNYDLVFIGTIHSDRLKIINAIGSKLENSAKFFRYQFLQAKWLFYFKKILASDFANSKTADFFFEPLSKAKISEVFSMSKAVLDIEHPNQSGLTMRTFEVLASGKKLVTTNKNILFYDFYDPHLIHIVDRENLDGAGIPKIFFSQDSPFCKKKFEKNYSLHAWIKEIFKIN